MRIYLIGLPGCGKTTIAKVLSQKLNYKYIDLDVAIEAREGKSISDIFAEKGEDYFRALETKLLEELINIDDVVIACGGGIVERNTRKSFSGLVVFLKADVTVLEERLKNDNTRPLLKNNTIYELAKKRNVLYSKLADLTIESVGLDTTVDLIIEGIKNEDFSSKWS